MATPTEAEDVAMTDADAAPDATTAGDQSDEQQKLSPELYEAMALMLEALYEYRDEDGHEPSRLFHKRPNRRNVPGYYDVIKEPMAMSSLKSKINGQLYTSFAEYVRDCALIWHNAFEFNRPDSIAYQDANTIKGVMEAEIEKIVEQDLVTAEAAEWPDLGEIPPVDEDAEGENEEEDGESGEDDEEEEEGADNSEAEANKPRRRGRRPSAPKRSDSQAEGSAKRRGRPPKVDTPLEARIKNVLKAIRKPKLDNGVPMILDFEKLPDKAQFPEYYQVIAHPVSLEQIKRAMKRKRYRSVDDCVAELDVMFNNAKQFNEEDSPIYNAAVRLINVAHQVAKDEKQKPDESFGHEEGRKPKPGGIQHNGQLWKVGDWVHIQNPNDAAKPIVAQIYRAWEDEEGRDWINACWYYRPEQTVHHFEKHFWPNEVLKTSQYRDHPIEDVIDKCFVMFFTRFTRGRPRNLPEGTEVYVCEARYNEEKHKINKIKTWSSCLPDEVRDHDYEMDLFDTQRKIKKVSTPLEHLVNDAKDPANAPLPQPKMGAEYAPPTEGGVYKGLRDENQSPPPSPTPSPPPPAPAQPVRPMATPAREPSAKVANHSDVDAAMAHAQRAFGVPGSGKVSTNFVAQRQQSVAGTPLANQYPYGSQNASGQTSQQPTPRASYDGYAGGQSANRFSSSQQSNRPLSQAQANSTNRGPVRLSDAVNSSIPPEVRARLHTDDGGHVLFFYDAPLQYSDVSDGAGGIPSHMRTSIRYRAQKLREKMLRQKRDRAEKQSEEVDNETPAYDAGVKSGQASEESAMEVDTGRQNSTSDTPPTHPPAAAQQTSAQDASSDRQPLWKTNPLTVEELMLVEPEEILKIDPRRVCPTDNLVAQASGMPFLQWAYQMQKGTIAIAENNYAPDIDRRQAYKDDIQMSWRIRAQTEQNEAERYRRELARKEKEQEERDNVFKKPAFYIEDVDPLYCGVTWTGPNPGEFKY